jgi:Ankyrin repeats (3 copies)
MKLRQTSVLLFTLLLTSAGVVAQNSKQELNDQLWEATRKGDAAAVTALLDKGADVNAKFRYGSTALFKAAERGHAEVIKVLLARGADVTVKDTFYGATAMTWALSNEHVEAIKALLEKDTASVGDVLMTGVRGGKTALVEIALARGGAKPETMTAALAAALDDKEKAAIADMLKKAGAVPPPEIDAATLQTYVGRYKNDQGLEIGLQFKDGKLLLVGPSPPPFALSAIDKITFRPTAFEGMVITVNVEGGKVGSVSVKQGANTTVFNKVIVTIAEEPKPQ